MIEGIDHDHLLYKMALELQRAPEYSPRGMRTKELINANLMLENPRARIITNTARKFSEKYVAAETTWYLRGDRDIGFIAPYASMWERVANPDKTANSAYGYSIWKMPLPNYEGSQYDWVVNSLLQDKDTRQAVINFNTPEHKDPNTKDFVCTETAQYFIRDNKLISIVNMRSNDGIWGTSNDIAFFTFLQEMVMADLKRKGYPKLQLGPYFHNAGSLHVYERHFGMLDDIVQTYEGGLVVSDKMPTIDNVFLQGVDKGEYNRGQVGEWLESRL